jgi:Uma2 family endonuclease
MSTVTPVQPKIRSAALPPFPVCKSTVDEYHRAIAAGIYGEDDHVELIRGWVVPKMPQNAPHRMTITLSIAPISKRLPSGWHLLVQLPVSAPESEPEPDLGIARGSGRDYPETPKAPDVQLLVEAADSSLDYDRTFKKELYAEAGFPYYWIINLLANQVEVYSDPTGPGLAPPDYRQSRVYNIGDEVPLVLDGVEVARVPVDELLP